MRLSSTPATSTSGGPNPAFSAFLWPWYDEVRNYTALLSGRSWLGPDGTKAKAKPIFLTYSFQTRMTEADDEAWRGNHSRWAPFSTKDKADAREALKKWGDVSGITFLEAKGDHGDIQFSWMPQKDSSGIGYYPASTEVTDLSDSVNYVESYSDISGNIYLDTNDRDNFARDRAWKKYVLLHEVGHALGLKHPFDTTFYNGRVLTDKYNSVSHTVMAYLEGNQSSPTSLKHFDIEAIRKLYGSNKQDGKQVAKWSWNFKTEVLTQIGKKAADVLWGTKVTDRIYGDSGNDRLHGFDGDDLLSGGAGSDVLIGGPGRDSFRFDYVADSSIDSVLDFDPNQDRMELSSAVFGDLGAAGPLAANKFASGVSAPDKLARIIVDGASLTYDSDGSGPTAPIVIAHLKLTTYDVEVNAGHFWVI